VRSTDGMVEIVKRCALLAVLGFGRLGVAIHRLTPAAALFAGFIGYLYPPVQFTRAASPVNSGLSQGDAARVMELLTPRPRFR